MDPGETQYLFKETRLNLEPPSPSSVVTVRVPASNGPSKRKQPNGEANGVEDETTFRSRNLATASSIYHRKWHDSPRSFLWRVLDDGTTLSVRAVDVCRRDKATADAPLVLNFSFSTPILPSCVALADPKEHDALCVFVLDQAHVLWTFTLRPDLFRKRTAVDAGLSEVAKRHSPTGLSFKHPHRMVAVSADVLLVTVNDGGMMRFDRTIPDDCEWKVGRSMMTLNANLISFKLVLEGVFLQRSGVGPEPTKPAPIPGKAHYSIRQGQHGVQRCDSSPSDITRC